MKTSARSRSSKRVCAHRRHNPYSLQDFLTFLRDQKQDRLVYLVGKHPQVVEPYLEKIHARLVEKGLLRVEPPAAKFTDRDGWLGLAALVPEALSDQPKALQDALIAEFKAEAAKAAA